MAVARIASHLEKQFLPFCRRSDVAIERVLEFFLANGKVKRRQQERTAESNAGYRWCRRAKK